ncbi:MAG TPA: methyltransferase domain-containing protein [Herpetosiphonaceae bacterium]|nr:methyltransferase domain-containing protein [Herpetosiphonaceae bacterium]
MTHSRGPLLHWSGRSDARELLDAPVADLAELRENLDDIYRLNRLIGATGRLIRRITELVAGVRDTVRVLDVGTGSADIPIALVAWARRSGAPIRVTAVDRSRQVAAVARERVAGYPEIEVVEGDGCSLPFGAGSYHAATCSLTLHHLGTQDGIRLLQNLDRVTRHGFVVSDLTRGALAYWSTWLFIHALTRNRLTRHDGPLSVTRAYTVAELRQLVEEAAIPATRVCREFPWKAIIVQDKRA